MMTDQPEPGTEIATVEPRFSDVLASQQSRAVFLPANLGQAMELAHFMAGGIGVRAWMRGNPSACLALIQISMRWGMDPYIVANKAYYANDTLSFESQLVNAVINTSGALIGRLKVEFSGDADGGEGRETLNCRVRGRLVADPDQEFVHEQALQTVKIRNSPLWKVNPRQQLQYHATRAWARLYMPEVLLGIYTPDEIADGVAARLEAESHGSGAPAPDRRDFVEERGEEADFTPIETVLPESGSEEAESDEKPGETADSGRQEAENAAADVDSEDNSTVPSDDSGAEVVHDGLLAESHSTAVEGEDELDQPIADPIPVEPLEWSVWKRDMLAFIEAVTDENGFNALRKRMQPALDQAGDDLLGEMQDALADKLATLPIAEKHA